VRRAGELGHDSLGWLRGKEHFQDAEGLAALGDWREHRPPTRLLLDAPLRVTWRKDLHSLRAKRPLGGAPVERHGRG
jgi:hypothetical protein